jgi:hypothetical protein
VDGLVTISFAIRVGKLETDLAILFWDESAWIRVDGAGKSGDRFEAQVDYTGNFILVSR